MKKGNCSLVTNIMLINMKAEWKLIDMLFPSIYQPHKLFVGGNPRFLS